MFLLHIARVRLRSSALQWQNKFYPIQHEHIPLNSHNGHGSLNNTYFKVHKHQYMMMKIEEVCINLTIIFINSGLSIYKAADTEIVP